MPATPTHLHDDSAPCANRSGYDVLGEAMVDLCKVGGVAEVGVALIGGRSGGEVGIVVGALLVVATHMLRRRERP